jgi:thiosulfate dehydrogenase [quinone] large subunit
MSPSDVAHPTTAAQIPEPPIARFLFADPRMAGFWLVVRLYVAYEWLTAGIDKLTGHSFAFGSDFGAFDPKTQWVFNGHEGTAIKGFASFALTKSGGAHPDVQGFYAWFLREVVLPHASVFAYLITFGEVAVGLGLLVGALTGIAAFFGLFMNLNYLLAGTVSTNPVLGIAALGLVLAWRVAGYYGLDRWLLPLLGTPWTGSLARYKGPKPTAPLVP